MCLNKHARNKQKSKLTCKNYARTRFDRPGTILRALKVSANVLRCFLAGYLEFVSIKVACASHSMKLDNTTLQDFSGNSKLHFTIKMKKISSGLCFDNFKHTKEGKKGERPPRDREKIRFPLVVRA